MKCPKLLTLVCEHFVKIARHDNFPNAKIGDIVCAYAQPNYACKGLMLLPDIYNYISIVDDPLTGLLEIFRNRLAKNGQIHSKGKKVYRRSGQNNWLKPCFSF